MFANVLQVISLVGENWVVQLGTIGLFGSANFCQCFIGYLSCGGKMGCSSGNNIQLRPSVQGNIQICQPEGTTTPRGLTNLDGKQLSPQVDKSGCFPTQRAVIVLLYFCQCFIGYLPCGGKLGCSAGNNRVVSRQREYLPLFYRLSLLWGEIGLFGGEQEVLFGGEQQSCFPAAQILAKYLNYFIIT